MKIPSRFTLARPYMPVRPYVPAKPLVAQHFKATNVKKPVNPSLEQKRKEYVELLRGLPPSPHMVKEPIVLHKAGMSQVDEKEVVTKPVRINTNPFAAALKIKEEKEDSETKTAGQMKNLEGNKLLTDIKKEKDEVPTHPKHWNPFAEALYAEKVKKEIDLLEKSAHGKSQPLHEIKNEDRPKVVDAVSKLIRSLETDFKKLDIENRALPKAGSVAVTVPSYQPVTLDRSKPSSQSQEAESKRFVANISPTKYSMKSLTTKFKQLDTKSEVTPKVKSVIEPVPSFKPVSFDQKSSSSLPRTEISHKDQVAAAQKKINTIESMLAEIKRREAEIQLLQQKLAVKTEKSSKKKVLTEPIKTKALQNFKISLEPVPYPKAKELKGTKTFAVSLLEITTPSQFIFQFNHKELQDLTSDMT